MDYYVDYALAGKDYKWAAMTKDMCIIYSDSSLENVMVYLKGKNVFLSDIAAYLLGKDEDNYASSIAEYKNVKEYLQKKDLEQMQRDLDSPDPFDPE